MAIGKNVGIITVVIVSSVYVVGTDAPLIGGSGGAYYGVVELPDELVDTHVSV